MAVDWKRVGTFAEAHWPYLLIGLIAVTGLFYTMSGGSAATSTTAAPAAPDNTVAQLQAATAQDQISASLAATEFAGQVQTAIAKIGADAAVAQSNASASSAGYIATVQAESNTANYALAAASGQNIQALQSLATGFSSYAGSLAQMTAADATAAAGVANSNDSTAGRTIGATFQGAAQLVGAFAGAGLLSSLARPQLSGYSLLPNISSVRNLSAPVVASPGYVDSGTWQLG